LRPKVFARDGSIEKMFFHEVVINLDLKKSDAIKILKVKMITPPTSEFSSNYKPGNRIEVGSM
jgi:hypothetical protein